MTILSELLTTFDLLVALATPGSNEPVVDESLFKSGNITLNSQAAVDVRINEVLFTGLISEDKLNLKNRLKAVLKKDPNNKNARSTLRKLISEEPTDQTHIYVTKSGKLSYETLHEDTFDPFRWSKLQDIVNSANLDIFAVTDGKFRATVWDGTNTKEVNLNLNSLKASGITLPRLTEAKKIWTSQTEIGVGTEEGLEPNNYIAASVEENRDQIYYLSNDANRITLSENALAHELFGHLWLLIQKAPWLHPKSVDEVNGELAKQGKPALTNNQMVVVERLISRFGTLTEADNILDPFGNIFTGTVNNYINSYAGASINTLASPTHWVSDSRLNEILLELHDNLLTKTAMKWTEEKVSVPIFSGEQLIAWAYLSNNYIALDHNQVNDTAKRRTEQILSQIVGWFQDFDNEGKVWFRQMMSKVLETHIPQKLKEDVIREIGWH